MAIMKKSHAQNTLRLVASSRGGGDVAFVCGKRGKRGEKDRFVFLAGVKKPQTLVSQAKNLEWDDSSKAGRKETFTPLAFGKLELREGTLHVSLKKPYPPAKIRFAAVEFLKEFSLKPTWGSVVVHDEWDEAAFQEREEDNVLAQAPSAEEIAEESSAFSDENGDAAAISEEREDLEDEPQLPPGTSEFIQSQIDNIVDNLMQVAGAVGINLPADQSAISAKLAGWLKRLLVGQPEEQMLALAANWLSRLQLAIMSSTQSIRDAAVAANSSDRPESSEEALGDSSPELDGTSIIANVDLNTITTSPVERDEVVEVLFARAKALAVERDLDRQYDISGANDARIRQVVNNGWNKVVPGDQVGTIVKFTNVLEKVFADSSKLVDFLGLKEFSSLSPAEISARARANWKSAIDRVVSDIRALRNEADQFVLSNYGKTVEDFGGTWEKVDAVVADITEPAVENALGDLAGTTEERVIHDATEALEAVKARVSKLMENEMVELLEAAPFPSKPVITSSLQSTAGGVEKMLSGLLTRVG
ncbi:hypothetical protein [Ensifer adhaerens]